MNTSSPKISEAMSSNPSRRRRRRPHISRHSCHRNISDVSDGSEGSMRSSPASLQTPPDDHADDATVKHSNITILPAKKATHQIFLHDSSGEESDASDLSTRAAVEGRRIENDVILPSISLTQFFSSKQAKKSNNMDDDSCCAVRGSSPTELMMKMKICEIEVPTKRSQQKSTKMKRKITRRNSLSARTA